MSDYLKKLAAYSLAYECRILIHGQEEAEAAYTDLFNRAISDLRRDRAAEIMLREWRPDPDALIH